jgi:hypothetical protein
MLYEIGDVVVVIVNYLVNERWPKLGTKGIITGIYSRSSKLYNITWEGCPVSKPDGWTENHIQLISPLNNKDALSYLKLKNIKLREDYRHVEGG